MEWERQVNMIERLSTRHDNPLFCVIFVEQHRVEIHTASLKLLCTCPAEVVIEDDRAV